jgi:hypothetical protein
VGSVSKKKQNQLSGTAEALTAEHQMQGVFEETTRLSSFLEQKTQCLGWLEKSCFRRCCQGLSKEVSESRVTIDVDTVQEAVWMSGH